MQIIPVINASTFEEAKEKIKLVSPYCEWVQIDIADGIFTEHKTWDNPEDLLKLENVVNIEIHLMVSKPESVVENWLKIPQVKRILVHVEAISDFDRLQKLANEYQKELGLVINPETSIDLLKPYLKNINFVQLLAVKPGLAGQALDLSIVDKIKALKTQKNDVIIEIDGGVNLENVKILKQAGADVLTSASYIFNSVDIKEAIESLKL
jgi:ribulose-phosphate 3-epimerase